LAQPAYPDDDGAVDPAVQAAVDEYARGGQFGDVLVALGTARIIVPVVAMPARTAPDPRAGSAGQKEGEMAAVLTTGADGRTALLAFTGLPGLQRWDPHARPVPVSTPDAARAATDEGATAIVIDIAGPVRVVVETGDLEQLAAGRLLFRTGSGYAWGVRP